MLILFVLIFNLLFPSGGISPVAWSKGEPIWIEGEPLPPPGNSWIVLCARKRGVFLRNPSEEGVFRPARSLIGHAWLEFVNSNGNLSSISTHMDSTTNDVSNNDYTEYRFDKDTFRLAFLVPDSLADQAFEAAEQYAKNGYNLFCHNCVHTTGHGANAVGLDEFFDRIFPSFSEDGSPFERGRITTPTALYSALEGKVSELKGWNHPLSNPSKELRNQVVWVYLAADDPYTPSIFQPPTSLQLEKDYSIAMIPTRGNFGGVSFSRRAEFCLRLDEIYGAIFDETTQQIILVGRTPIHLPELKLDDLAVAMQSIYGLRGNPSQDPGVSIDPEINGQMPVRFFGETRNTAFGKALFDADYTLKMLTIGEYPCYVSGFNSLSDRVLRSTDKLPPLSCNSRIWIIPKRIALEKSSDGSAMVFQETKMECLNEMTCNNPSLANQAMAEFACHFTENYDAISKEYPIFSEMKRLGQITGVVKWLKDHQIPFDYSFFQGYNPVFVKTPDSVPPVMNNRMSGQNFANLSGGILFQLGKDNYSLEVNSNVNSFKERAIASRPDELTFSWKFDDLSAQAFPFVKTQKTGDFRTAFIDLQIPVIGDFPLVLTRYYDSFNDEDVGFGRGWSISPFHILTPQIFNRLPYCVVREGNQHWIYQYIGNDFYVREDHQQLLQIHSDGSSTLQLQKGGVVSFDLQGHPVYLLEPRGFFLHFCYENGALIEIRHQSGKKIQLVWSGDRIVQSIGSDEGSYAYHYNEQQLLGSIEDEKGLKRASYKYDQDLRLSEIRGAKGQILFRGSYDDYNRLATCRWSCFEN